MEIVGMTFQAMAAMDIYTNSWGHFDIPIKRNYTVFDINKASVGQWSVLWGLM